jgi:hypothetical protein
MIIYFMHFFIVPVSSVSGTVLVMMDTIKNNIKSGAVANACNPRHLGN